MPVGRLPQCFVSAYATSAPDDRCNLVSKMALPMHATHSKDERRDT